MKDTKICQKVPETHILGWTPQVHYMGIGGQCGQSCPCCRAMMGEILGACLICNKIKKKNKSK